MFFDVPQPEFSKVDACGHILAFIMPNITTCKLSDTASYLITFSYIFSSIIDLLLSVFCNVRAYMYTVYRDFTYIYRPNLTFVCVMFLRRQTVKGVLLSTKLHNDKNAGNLHSSNTGRRVQSGHSDFP